jgi:hypothetical protein
VGLEFLIHTRRFRPHALKDFVETGERFCTKCNGSAVFPVGQVDDDALIFEVDIVQPVDQMLPGDVTLRDWPWFRTGPFPHAATHCATFVLIAVSTPHAKELPFVFSLADVINFYSLTLIKINDSGMLALDSALHNGRGRQQSTGAAPKEIKLPYFESKTPLFH